MDGKNIDIYLTRNRQSCSILMASGFEKFMCSIAIRVAMMNVSLLPKPNFIAIDEGFGALDAENLGGINVLFNYLKGDFEIVLIISHIDLLKNDVENVISPADLKVDNDNVLSLTRPQHQKIQKATKPLTAPKGMKKFIKSGPAVISMVSKVKKAIAITKRV